jgi:hypothetical protein
VAGSWVVVCSDAGGHAGALGPEGNWLAPAGQDVFPAVKRTAGEAGPSSLRVKGKDLERTVRAEREAGCVQDRGCEADKSEHTTGPATGARTGADPGGRHGGQLARSSPSPTGSSSAWLGSPAAGCSS